MTTRADFVASTASGRRWVTPSFVLQAWPAAEGSGSALARQKAPDSDPQPSAHPPPKVGFTCSKKVGGAVQRNRLKRRLREVARAVIPGASKPGWHYVLVGRARERELPFDQMVRDLGWAIGKLHGGADLNGKPPGDGRTGRRRSRRSTEKNAARPTGSGAS